LDGSSTKKSTEPAGMKPILATAAPEAEGISHDRQGGARESHLELLHPYWLDRALPEFA
jgi:hypothetical protein